MGKSKIRIKDIALRAGVSTGTVDRVLHDRGHVSSAAREKVLKALEEMDYSPNIMARALASKKSIQVISLMPQPDSDPYWQLPQLGLEKALQGVEHYGVLNKAIHFDLFSSRDFRKKAEAILAGEPFDALLVAPIFQEESLWLLDQVNSRHIPVILINTDLIESEVLSYVGQDSHQSGILAGRLLDLVVGPEKGEALLLNLGKETRENARHLREKEAGFRKYLAATHLTVETAEFDSYMDPDLLRAFVADLRSRHTKLRGLFITNSRAYFLLRSAGDLLEDVRLVGFDLLPENLAYLQKRQIDFIINQNPVQQGYIGLMTAVNHVLFEKSVARRQHLPLDVVLPENAIYYLEREKEYQLIV